MRARLTRRIRPLGHLTLTATAALLAIMLLTAAPGQAQSPGDGEAVVVSAEDGSPITGGGGDTTFSLALPDGAACPGDSEEGEYRVQSFLVPASVDPGGLQYKGLRPQTEGGWALYEVDTTTYMNRPTAKATEPGGEGTIINIPAFSFAVFDPGMIPLGRARIGIACSLYSETERYWATEVEIVADDGDPAGIAWTVIDPPTDAAQGDDSSSAIPVAIAVAVGTGAVILGRRRRRGPVPRKVASET
jgi:hypothetical protein